MRVHVLQSPTTSLFDGDCCHSVTPRVVSTSSHSVTLMPKSAYPPRLAAVCQVAVENKEYLGKRHASVASVNNVSFVNHVINCNIDECTILFRSLFQPNECPIMVFAGYWSPVLSLLTVDFIHFTGHHGILTLSRVHHILPKMFHLKLNMSECFILLPLFHLHNIVGNW